MLDCLVCRGLFYRVLREKKEFSSENLPTVLKVVGVPFLVCTEAIILELGSY